MKNSFRGHANVPEQTKTISLKIIGKDYFKLDRPTTESKIILIEDKVKELEKLEIYGYDSYNSNHTLCLKAIDLLMKGSDEEANRKEVLKIELLDKVDVYSNCLSIGVGNGDMTMYIAAHCKKLTVIDHSIEALENIPDYFGNKNTSVTKIHGSVLDVELSKAPEDCFDLIDFLHTIYTVKNQYRLPLIDKLLESTCSGGKLVIAYNSGGKRADIIDSFSDKGDDLNAFALRVLSDSKYNAYGLSSLEILTSKTINAPLYVSGLFLFDNNISSNEANISSWLNYNAYNTTHYQLDSNQYFLIFEAE